MKWSLILIYLFIIFDGYTQPAERIVYFHIDKLTIKEKLNGDSLMFQNVRQDALNTFQLNGFIGITPADTIIKARVTHYYFDFLKQFKKTTLENVDDENEKPL